MTLHLTADLCFLNFIVYKGYRLKNYYKLRHLNRLLIAGCNMTLHLTADLCSLNFIVYRV